MRDTERIFSVTVPQALEWAAKGKRAVKIEVENMPGNAIPEVKCWVYDYELMAGQYISAIEEIDLQGSKEEKDRMEYERLKAKFEVEDNA
jgi:hypothetical protein